MFGSSPSAQASKRHRVEAPPGGGGASSSGSGGAQEAAAGCSGAGNFGGMNGTGTGAGSGAFSAPGATAKRGAGGGAGASGAGSGGVPGGAKKLVIKPLKSAPKVSEAFEETTWATLEAAVRAVHASTSVGQSLEQLYRGVEDLCVSKLAPKYYAKLAALVDAQTRELVAGLERRRSAECGDASSFLKAVEETWEAHCEQTLTIRSIFLYLDRTYVIQTHGVRSIWDMGLAAFRRYYDSHPEMGTRVTHGVLSMIASERGGEVIPRSLLRNVCRMLTSLGLYLGAQTDGSVGGAPTAGVGAVNGGPFAPGGAAGPSGTAGLERPLLDATAEFYREEGERVLAEADVPDYLKHVERRLEEESQRAALYLDGHTRKPLIATCERMLLERHVRTLLDKGFKVLMDDDVSLSGGAGMENLQRLYSLMGRVDPAADEIRLAFSAYVKATGKLLVMDEGKDKDMVDNLLAFKEKLTTVVGHAFNKNESITNSLKDAFETFINQRQSRPAELIAKWVDGKLRGGGKGTTEEELEGDLDKVLTLFRYIQGKDVFEAFYKKDLAKRLLLGRSSSIDAEKLMISKLKQECGSQFTTKLEGMFKDIEISADINASFKQSAQARRLADGSSRSGGSAPAEVSVHVLTSVNWPTYPQMEVKLPRELSTYQEAFKEHYLSKHSGRRLTWQNSLGHCMLKAVFPGKDGRESKKDLQVSLLQTIVLMLFNDDSAANDGLTCSQIADSTGIEEGELKLTLLSLACGKYRVLQKSPKGKEVEKSDSFTFNADFTAPLIRIKINTIQMKETKEENEATHERVFQDRQYQVDAAIVRIMKTRKTLSHTLLINELYNQLKFPMKPAELKKRIESLIDREYLERDSENPQVYIYLA